MKLSYIASACGLEAVGDFTDIDVKGITCDSRNVNQGDLFICINGTVVDGHKYIPDAAAKLRVIYKGLMELRYDNARTRKNAEISGVKDLEKKTPLELFKEFFELQNNAPMSEEQSALVQEIVESIWEEEV